MNGLPHHYHPMFGRGGVPPAAHPAFDDAFSNGYAAAVPTATATATGMDPLVLQQEIMRRQDHVLAAAAPPTDENAYVAMRNSNGSHDYIAEAMEAELAARGLSTHAATHQPFRNDSVERMAALQEQQAVRQQQMERARLAQLGGRSGRAFSGALHHHQADAAAQLQTANNRFSADSGGDRPLAVDISAARSAPGLAEEMALRERLQRRVLEEEAVKNLREHQLATLGRQQAMTDGRDEAPSFSAYGGGGRPLAMDPFTVHSSPGLAEELALRERLQRRMLEQEAIKNCQEHQPATLGRHQAMVDGRGKAPPAPVEGEQLARLLQLQQMYAQERLATTSHHQHQQATMDPSWGQGESQPTTSVAERERLAHPLELQKNEEREQLARLIRLQQMSEADEVQTTAGGARKDALEHTNDEPTERQLIEAMLLRSGLAQSQEAARADQDSRPSLGAAHQAHTNAAIARRFSPGSEKLLAGRQAVSPTQKGSPTQKQMGIPREDSIVRQWHGRHYDGPHDTHESLEHFDSRFKVDTEGRAPLTDDGHTPATVRSNDAPAVANHASPDNNIVAKFLTVVVSRVPEIAPAIAKLLPDSVDPALLKQEFPNIVEATLAALGTVRDRFADAGDAGSIDLVGRVTSCIAAIEPHKGVLSAAVRTSPSTRLPQEVPPVHPALTEAAPSAAAGTRMRPAPSEPGIVDPLVHSAMASRTIRPAAQSKTGTDPFARQPLMPLSDQTFYHPIMNAAFPRPGYFPPQDVLSMAQWARQHQVATMALMSHQARAFHPDASSAAELTTLSNKKEDGAKPESPSEDTPMMATHKAEKKQHKKVAAKKKKKKNRKPRLVHHTLIPGALDSPTRKAILAREKEARRERALATMAEGSLKSKSSVTARELRAGKKQRISGQGEMDGAGVSIHPIFGLNGKPSSDSKKEGAVKRSVQNSTRLAVAEESKMGRGREYVDGHNVAASVLLDLMDQ